MTASTETSEEGDLGYEANAMVNVPLVDEQLAARVVGYHRDRGGYIDNVTLKREDINTNEPVVAGSCCATRQARR